MTEWFTVRGRVKEAISDEMLVIEDDSGTEYKRWIGHDMTVVSKADPDIDWLEIGDVIEFDTNVDEQADYSGE